MIHGISEGLSDGLVGFIDAISQHRQKYNKNIFASCLIADITQLMQDKHCKDTFFAVYHYNLLVLHKLSNIKLSNNWQKYFVVFLPVL